MKKFSMIILAIVVLFALPTPVLAINEWTVVVYMVNDDDKSSLEDANFDNLRDLKSYDLYKIGKAFYSENSSLNRASNGAVIMQMGKELMDAIDAARVSGESAISIIWPEKA